LSFNHTERLRADLALLLVALIWGSAFVAQRIAGLYGSVFLFNGVRFLLSAAVLLPFVPWKRRPLQPARGWAALAGFLLFAASALQQHGLRWTTAGNAGFLTSLYVVLVPFALWIGWRDRPRVVALVAVLLAGMGAFLLSTGGDYQIQAGDVFELAGAGLWALHVIVVGKYAGRAEVLAFSVGQFLVCALLNLAVGLPLEVDLLAGLVKLIGPILYTSLGSIAIGFTLQVWAQRHALPTDAALLLSLESVFAVIFGWLVLGETLSTLQGAGCGLILVGVLLVQWRPGKRQNRLSY